MIFITVMHIALFSLVSVADIPTSVPSGMKGWTDSSALVFHNTVSPESLIDIPILVILTPDRIDYDRCKADGSDLRFLDRHGTVPLDHEIVSWNPGSASHIWVRVPQIEAASERDFIWMVWGNPDAPDVQNAPGVWQNGYVGVWHLTEGYEDATGRTEAAIPDERRIRLPQMTTSETHGGSLTLEAHCRIARLPEDYRGTLLMASDVDFGLHLNQSGSFVLDDPRTSSWCGTWPIFTEPRTHTVAGVIDADAEQNRVFVDGLPYALAGWRPEPESEGLPATLDWMVGARQSDPTQWRESFQGDITEVRLSSVARSRYWLHAQHESIADRFITFHPQPPPVYTQQELVVAEGVQQITPLPYDRALRNPLKGFRPGFITWYKPWSLNSVHHPFGTVIRDYIRWHEIEQSASDDVEKLNAYCNQKWKGLEDMNVKVIPRVYLEWPKDGKRDPKGWYGPSDMERFDYSSQQFRQRLRQMIAKMGEAWNNDPRVAYIEMGLIGFWGEQHDPFISPANELLLREMFEEHLGRKKILIRHPWDFPGSAFGVYWDSFAHFDREVETQAIELSERWRQAPIGGETAYDYGNAPIQPGDDPDDTLRDSIHFDHLRNTIRRVHANHVGWVSNYDKNDLELGSKADEIQKMLGYRFVLETVQMPRSIQPDSVFQMDFTVKNTGSSPLYEAWPVEVSLLDSETHKPVWRALFKDVDIRRWLPGDHWDVQEQTYRVPAKTYKESARFRLPKDLPNGEYILALAVLDPAGYRPCLRFATANYFRGGRHPMGYVAVGLSESPRELSGDEFDDPAEDDSLGYKLEQTDWPGMSSL